MNWQEFETIVRSIYEQVGKPMGMEVVCSGPKCRVTGKSGTYQIDVLTKHTQGFHTYLTAIECKWWNDKVDRDVVIKVHGIRTDCTLDKVVIVSKIGFTEDAVVYAEMNGIHLVELKEHNLTISGNILTKIYAHITINHPELVGINLQAAPNTQPEYGQHPILTAPDQFLRMGKEELDLQHLTNEFLNKQVLPLKDSDLFRFIRTFDQRTTLRSRSIRGGIPVTSIEFVGYNRRYTRLDTDYFTNKIWLAMKLIFEKRQYIVTIGGEIEPLHPGEPIELSQGRVIRWEMVGNARQFTIIKNMDSLNAPDETITPTGTGAP